MANVTKEPDHPDIHKIIEELRAEPCLYDPNAQYYKNKKKRKEAYERVTAKVNENNAAKYTVKDIMAIVKNLRSKYREQRSYRMSEFLRYKCLPAPHKWWSMLNSFIKDENKFSEEFLVDEGESIKETKRRFDKSIKLYMKAEKELMEDLSSDEDSDTNKDSDHESDGPAAKKSKTDDNSNDRKPRLINDMDDSEADFLIYALRREPCLCDPGNEFYNNKEKKEEAFQRMTVEMNEEFGNNAFTVEDIKENMNIIRKLYREHRNKRFQQFVKKEKLPRAIKWWQELHNLLIDENSLEIESNKKVFKAKTDKTIADYLEAERNSTH